MVKRSASSFRDPCGHVYVPEKDMENNDKVFRTINKSYIEQLDYINSCGLLEKAKEYGFIPCEELEEKNWPQSLQEEKTAQKDIVKVLSSPKLPFISYPYEWSFSQLKDAALLTLDLHLLALDHGCILKDASAYNVQFDAKRPIFIDLLSFERLKEGQPWQAYGQFCQHFLAPLALMARCDLRLGTLSSQYIDGVPLDLACKILPKKCLFSPGLAMHLYLHALMRKKHGDARESADKAKKSSLKIGQLKNIAESLKRLVEAICLQKQTSEWGDYYTDTNYSEAAKKAKIEAVRKFAQGGGKLALDLGANTGEFSNIISPYFSLVIASDFDALAVERNYLGKGSQNVLPLVLNIASPSPALGWQCLERPSFFERCKPDMLMALALCHHLVFTFGIDFFGIAACFAALLPQKGRAIVEFVPRDDSQSRRLLAARENIFANYDREHFIQAFLEAGFSLIEAAKLPESTREIMLFEKNCL